MRIVLVDHGGESVRGDTAVFAARSAEWAANSSKSIGHLSIVAARLLDESEGRRQWTYRFSPFGPRGPSAGYDIFACGDEWEDAAPESLKIISTVICRCSYMGYVHCTPPNVALGSRRRSAKDEHAREAIDPLASRL
jgi:hypothetical protein